MQPDPTSIDRHFVATAFVAWRGKLLLHYHGKLQMWLPCGGHLERGETPDQAAMREVYEESGVRVELIGEKALEVADPVQLVRPRGVQLEQIGPGHQHIDLIYFARPIEPYDGRLVGAEEGMGWYGREEVSSLPLTEELRAWTELAFRELVDEDAAAPD